MARKTRSVLAFALSAALALGTLPAPALAEMAEEAMGAEPIAAAMPTNQPAANLPSAQDSAPTEAQMGEEPVAPQAEIATTPDAAGFAAAPLSDQPDQSETADLATQALIAQGTWGTCQWDIDGNGTLTIHPGEAKKQTQMTYLDAPWFDYRGQIRYVKFEQVGNNKVVLPELVFGLFAECKNLTTVDFSGADSSKMTNFNYVFFDCTSLTTLKNMSNLNTSKLIGMQGVFYGCTSLNSLSCVSGWDVSKVDLASDMFKNCTSLTSLDGISNWRLTNAWRTDNMFSGCTSLTSLRALSGWDMSHVKFMENMFSGCTSLTSLDDISGWNTSSLESMEGLFSGCSSLRTVDLSGWNTSNVKKMSRVFNDCTSLTSLDVSGWDTSSVTRQYPDAHYDIDPFSWMYRNCHALSRISVGANYDMKAREAFPTEPAGTLWRSSATGRTFSGDEIVASRSGVVDTYTREGAGIVPAPTALGGTDWSAVYDPVWYADKNPDVAQWAKRADGLIDGDKLLSHFVNNGRGEGRSSKQGFELASYYNANPDLRRAFGGDWARYYQHYATNGASERRTCSGVDQLRGALTSRDGVDWAPVYDALFYAQRNTDVRDWATRRFSSGSVVDDAALLQHFVNSGTKECRASKAGFDVRSYYNANADLRTAFGGSVNWTAYYRHYATNGAGEGRRCSGANDLVGSVNVLSGTNWSPVYDRAYYGQRNPDIVTWATRKCGSATVLDDYAMLSHFASNGRKEGRASKQSFELASYYNANADLRRAFGTDWARYYDHYRGNGQREGRAAAGVGQLCGAVTTAESVNWAPVYDANFYAQRNPDVASWATRRFSSGSVLDDAALLSHFVNSGTREARASKAGFDVRAYKGKNADLARAFGTDWKSYYRHYAKFGVNEHRPCV